VHLSPDGAAELLSFLPLLGPAETLVFGESVNLPIRIILNPLEEEYRPHSSSSEFTDLWNRADVTPQFMETVFERWRARSLGKNTKQNARTPVPATQGTVQSLRHSFRKQVQSAPASTHQPSNHQAARPPLQPTAQNPVAASTSQMRQRFHRVASKPSSLADVKSMLNTAFNRDM